MTNTQLLRWATKEVLVALTIVSVCTSTAAAYSGMTYGTRLGKAGMILVPAGVLLGLAAYFVATRMCSGGAQRWPGSYFPLSLVAIVVVSVVVTAGSLKMSERMNWTAGNLVLAGIGPVAVLAARRRIDWTTVVVGSGFACATFLAAKYLMTGVSLVRNAVVRLQMQ